MTLLALIPACGGSKDIRSKSIRPFYGKPLLQWAIDVALVGAFVDQVVDSTDDPEIAGVVDIDTPLDWKWAGLLLEQHA